MLELKCIYSDDGVSLRDFTPNRDKGFVLTIVLEIGVKGREGSDIFKFTLSDLIPILI